MRQKKGNQYLPFIICPPQEKTELLKDNGSDDQCVSWLNKAEEYFDIYNITTYEEKLKYVPMHLEGHTYKWYIWWKADNFSYSWK